MADLRRILAAADFAAEKHADQRRKGSNAEPYINHPLEVAHVLAEVGKVQDDDIIVAALLHDTVEDTDTSFEEIDDLFGSVAGGYVRELTDDKSLPKPVRKRLQVEHAPHMSHGAKQIKLADKISNVRDVLENPPDKWSDKRRRKYIEWGKEVVEGLRGANLALEACFDELARQAGKKFD